MSEGGRERREGGRESECPKYDLLIVYFSERQHFQFLHKPDDQSIICEPSEPPSD